MNYVPYYEFRGRRLQQPFVLNKSAEVNEGVNWFKAQYALACQQSQEAVNDFLADFASDTANDETLREVAYRVGYSNLLRTAIFSMPELNDRLLEVILKGGQLNGPKYQAFDLKPLLRRNDLTANQLTIILENLFAGSSEELYIFLTAMKTELTYELIIELYGALQTRALDYHFKQKGGGKNFKAEAPDNLKAFFVEKAMSYEPELPEHWVANMLETFRNTWLVDAVTGQKKDGRYIAKLEDFRFKLGREN